VEPCTGCACAWLRKLAGLSIAAVAVMAFSLRIVTPLRGSWRGSRTSIADGSGRRLATRTAERSPRRTAMAAARNGSPEQASSGAPPNSHTSLSRW